jgi:hypothetical protein
VNGSSLAGDAAVLDEILQKISVSSEYSRDDGVEGVHVHCLWNHSTSSKIEISICDRRKIGAVW